MTLNLVNFRRRAREARRIGEILNEVAIRQGDLVLSNLLRERLGTNPPPMAPLPKAAMSAARDWEQILASTLGKRGPLLRRTLSFGARAITFWSSSFLGFLLPESEARFFKKDNPRNYISLQSAPFVTIEIILEWMKQLFTIALKHPELGDAEKEDLKWLGQWLQDMEDGLKSGARWRRRRNANPLKISLAPAAYARLEQWFSRGSKG